ncbi:hypothetical protein BJ138DRAFT_1157660 [Hygrophoropsis aurantiaca]|uniref:Uncharacterized protein n=1 Tax=Hygrophoropsis aurantiaca TaxID=72124 RepID=A0ACB8A5Z5_9AGAM|nr:hypothetical protein BJ138DRAFT_1157660 [Hygrophoropsis aurantiaca]
MLRRVLPRFPLFRVSAPILPMASRLAARPMPAVSLNATPRLSNSRLFQHFPARLTSSPSSPPSSPTSDPRSQLPPNATLSQRLKHLITSYGWYALGVYFIVGVVDFTVAFAAINLLGAEHVSHVATSVKEFVGGILSSRPPEPGREEMESTTGGGNHEGLYAMLVLAYTIHKTLFLPVRVGFTAALTPRLVGWLRMRGWAGGEGTRRAAREMRDKIRTNTNRD